MVDATFDEYNSSIAGTNINSPDSRIKDNSSLHNLRKQDSGNSRFITKKLSQNSSSLHHNTAHLKITPQMQRKSRNQQMSTVKSNPNLHGGIVDPHLQKIEQEVDRIQHEIEQTMEHNPTNSKDSVGQETSDDLRFKT